MSEGARRIVKRLKLSEAIHDAGETITQLEFSKPKARLYRLIDSTTDVGGDQVLAVIADLCDIGEEAVEELDWDDAAAASDIVGDLLGSKKKGSKQKKKAPRRGTGKRRKAGVKK